MTIKELKEMLSAYDENSNICIKTYDDMYGYDYILEVESYEDEMGDIVLEEVHDYERC